MDPLDQRAMAPIRGDDGREGVGDLTLGVPVGGDNAMRCGDGRHRLIVGVTDRFG
jgi:hypothetical protein